jgi:3-oxoacyl-[acyl-carrier protein] reductase
MNRDETPSTERASTRGQGRLAGRNAVVTGASSGIGRAIAIAFAREGASVLLTYRRNATGADQTADDVRRAGSQAFVLDADLSRESEVDRLKAEAATRLGGVDVWVNNAGTDILTGEGSRLSDLEKLDRALGVDLRATMLCSWGAAELMRPHGSGVILNVSWDHVLTGAPGRLAEIYAAAKGGVLAFSKCLALSLAPEVRVHVLAPGWIATAFAEGLAEDVRSRIAERAPLKRWGTPEDVAQGAVFLASAEAAFLTGTTLLVNGGAVM